MQVTRVEQPHVALVSHRLLQGLVEIGDQIIDVLDANGQSHQPVFNADGGTLFCGD